MSSCLCPQSSALLDAPKPWCCVLHIGMHEMHGQPHISLWPAGFMGYGPEESNTVVELTYNYGKAEYSKGNAYAQVRSWFCSRQPEAAPCVIYVHRCQRNASCTRLLCCMVLHTRLLRSTAWLEACVMCHMQQLASCLLRRTAHLLCCRCRLPSAPRMCTRQQSRSRQREAPSPGSLAQCPALAPRSLHAWTLTAGSMSLWMRRTSSRSCSETQWCAWCARLVKFWIAPRVSRTHLFTSGM